MSNDFLLAAGSVDLERLKDKLSDKAMRDEINNKVRNNNNVRNLALLHAVAYGKLKTARWLLEHGGATITTIELSHWTHRGESGKMNIWDLLLEYTLWHKHDKMAALSLLQIMVLKGTPPAYYSLETSLSVENRQVVREGKRIRTQLPAYLAQRQALLDEHSPLIAPLQALVCGYEEPTTTEELWATRLGKENAEV
jgi:hypothetical protein